ncbi:hypothetical protein C8R47DRAFT_629846 [Mycena vitilis]|nr:hypothetical protein C8R47DRAFT_629846 [Mycena vitilis]
MGGMIARRMLISCQLATPILSSVVSQYRKHLEGPAKRRRNGLLFLLCRALNAHKTVRAFYKTIKIPLEEHLAFGLNIHHHPLQTRRKPSNSNLVRSRPLEARAGLTKFIFPQARVFVIPGSALKLEHLH